MKYYEALGCGKPILASNIPYINEAPAMGFGQLVEDCHDVQEIAKALDHFYINKEYYHQLAPKIQAFARHNHTWQQRASAFLQQCHWLA